MDLEKLRTLTQEGQNDLEKEVLQLCNPQQIAQKIMNDLETEASKTAKEGGRRAMASFEIWSEPFTRHDGSVDYSEYFCGPLLGVQPNSKRKTLSEVLFGMVKRHISDNNIQLRLEFLTLSFCNKAYIRAELSW